MGRRHPITLRIDEAVSTYQKYDVEVTYPAVKEHVKRSLTWGDFSADEALDAIIDARPPRRLKELGYIVSDADEPQRKLFDDCTLAELDEQIAVKQRNLTYVENRLRADKAVRAFLAEKQAMSDEPLTAGDFADDVERILGDHGFGTPLLREAA